MLLPLPSKAKQGDQWWRIEIGLPLIFVAIQLLCFLIIFTYDTPKGALLKSDTRQCNKMLMNLFDDMDRVEKEIDNIEKVLNETVLGFITYRKEKM